MTRQQIRSERFKREFRRVKDEFGCGVYSYSEGMTRIVARKIARKRSKRWEAM